MTEITDLIPYEKNPRTLSVKQHDLLKSSLDEFGDLSGVVFNRKLGRLVGGHMRMEIFKKEYNPQFINITKLDNVDSQGTVAYGWVQITIGIENHRHSYREVDWDKEKHDEACIKANKLGGGWDQDILANEWPQDKLLEWGMEESDWEKEKSKDDKKNDIDLSDSFNEKFIIEIECENELKQEELYYKFIQEGLKCKVLTL